MVGSMGGHHKKCDTIGVSKGKAGEIMWTSGHR